MQRRQFRAIVRVLCVLMLLIGVVGCRKAVPSEPDDTKAQVTVSQPTAPSSPTRNIVEQQPATVVRFAVNDFEAPLYEAVIETFETANPGIEIELVSVNEVLELGAAMSAQAPDDAEQRLVAAADVVTFGARRETVTQGLIRDLTPLMEVDGVFSPSQYVEGSCVVYQWDGGAWSLPTGVNHRLIYYSKDAFDAAGVPYPESGWTWDDMRATAAAVTQGTGDDVSMWGLVWPVDLVYRLVEAQVGYLVDYAVEPYEVRFDDPSVVEAVRWLGALHSEDGSMPYVADEGDEVAMTFSQALIDKGQAAMWPDYALLWPLRKMQGNIGVVTFPEGEQNANTTPGWANAISMSAGTTEPEAAWRWMVYLSQQAPPSLGQVAPRLPAYLDVIESTGYWDQLDEELAGALRYALDHGYVVQDPVGHGGFTEGVRDVLSGELPAIDAMDRAQAAANESLMASAEVTPAPTFVVEPGEGEEADGADVTTISFVPGLGSLNLEPYRALAEQFNEAHPEIRVEVKMLDLTSGASLDIPSLASSADCFQWYPSLQDPQAVDAIISLQPFLETDETISVDDFYLQVVDSFVLQDQVWGLPADSTPLLIEYNRALFDEAGIAYPTVGWTWDDFLDAAVALTHGEGETKQYGYVAEVFESSDLLLMLERLGADYVDETGAEIKVTLNDPSVIEALDWYASLVTFHEVKPVYVTSLANLAGIGAAYVEREALINDGHAAMWTKTATTAGLFGPRTALDMGVVSLPMLADGRSKASQLTTSGYFVSAETPHRQACWQWLTWLTEQPTAMLGYPARVSLAESELYRQHVGEDTADAYRASVVDEGDPSSLDALDDDEWLSGAFFWLYQAHGNVVSGEMTAQEALDAAQTMVDDYAACVIAGGDRSTGAWQRCMLDTDPDLPPFLFPAAAAE